MSLPIVTCESRIQQSPRGHAVGAALLGTLMFAASGCGVGAPVERAAIEGMVLLDGEPLKNGRIEFTPTGETRGPQSGTEIIQGRFVVPEELGPTVGSNRVEIYATRATGRKRPAPAPAPPGTEIEETESIIPPRYNTDSELVVDIQSGRNQVDLELQP